MALVSALLVLSLIDLEHQLLPDVITLPGIALGLAASFLPDSPVTPLAALGASAGGWLAFAAVAKAYEKTRGVEGLGQGDWKLAALLGAFLGWQKMLLTVLLASLAGTLVGLLAIALRGRDMRYALPLGTFLGAAGRARGLRGRRAARLVPGALRWLSPAAARCAWARCWRSPSWRSSTCSPLAHGVRSQRRLRARVSEAAERRVEAARQQPRPGARARPRGLGRGGAARDRAAGSRARWR